MRRRTRIACAVALMLLPAARLAAGGEESPLHGAWRGNDAAAEAIYETLTVGAGAIAWGSPGNPNGGRCLTAWRLVIEGRGETFHGELYSGGEGKRYEIHTLALEPVDCARGVRYLQFALPTDVTPPRSHAEVVTFDQHWSLTGAHNFSRITPPADR